MKFEIVHNVDDRRHGWVGSWEVAPLDFTKLTEADIGRTVIYRDRGRTQAGTLTSWRDGTVFARYSRGDTAAGAKASDLVFGISRAPVEHIFTCLRCEMNLTVEAPTDECPVCSWKRTAA